MRAGLGMGVGRCGKVLADMGKGGQVWMSQTDWTRMGDKASELVWVCVGMRAGLG